MFNSADNSYFITRHKQLNHYPLERANKYSARYGPLVIFFNFRTCHQELTSQQYLYIVLIKVIHIIHYMFLFSCGSAFALLPKVCLTVDGYGQAVSCLS